MLKINPLLGLTAALLTFQVTGQVSAMAQSMESFKFDVASTQVTFPAPLVVSGTLPLFDTSLGTLTGVQITLSATDTPVILVYNTTGSNQDFDFASFGSDFSVQSSNNNGSSTTEVSSQPTYFIEPITTAQPGLNTFTGDPDTESQMTAIAPTQFSLYEGSGGMTFPVSLTFTEFTPVFTGGDTGPGVFFGGGIQASSTLTVQYTYTAAPEPSLIGLLFLGVAALFGFRFFPVRKLSL